MAGYTRKHATKLMNRAPRAEPVRRQRRPGRPRSYRHCLAVVEVLWEPLDFCCAERLHPKLLPLAKSLASHKAIR
jgi:hypothetical protein